MTRARNATIFFLGSVLLTMTLSGCMLRGPSGVKRDVARASGAELDWNFGWRVGRVGMFLAKKTLKWAGEDQIPLDGVKRVQVGLYDVRGYDEDPRGLCRLEMGDWTPAVRVCSPDEQVLMFFDQRDESIRGMLVVVAEEEELVIVRATGRLERIVEQAMQMAREGDWNADHEHAEPEPSLFAGDPAAADTVCIVGSGADETSCADPGLARDHVRGVSQGLLPAEG